MADIITEIDQILQNEVVERHSFYQLKFFILGSEPTHQSKMQCCLRELRSRRISLQNIHHEIEELKDTNALLNLEANTIEKESPTDSNGILLSNPDEIEKFNAERSIELRRIKRRVSNNEQQIFELQRKIRFLIEECQFFVSAFDKLQEEEPLKPFDSLEVQREYWDAKLGKEFKTRLILGQPLDSELVKAIEELHDEATTKKSIIQLMRSQEQFNKDNGLPTVDFQTTVTSDHESVSH